MVKKYSHILSLFANSDLSGFSIFEEAQYRGIAAAEKVLNAIAGHGRPVSGN